jgi:hypothetical protein
MQYHPWQETRRPAIEFLWHRCHRVFLGRSSHNQHGWNCLHKCLVASSLSQTILKTHLTLASHISLGKTGSYKCFAETVSDGSSDEQARPSGGLVGGVAGVRSFSIDHVQAGGLQRSAVPPIHDWQGHIDPGLL